MISPTIEWGRFFSLGIFIRVTENDRCYISIREKIYPARNVNTVISGILISLYGG